MTSRIYILTLIVLTVILTSTPAQSNRLYSWKDIDGVLTFSDDPSYAPKGVRVEVVSDYPDSLPATESNLIETEEAERMEHSSVRVTQGEFALQLVKELGFSQRSTEKEAANLLTTLRIAPHLGQWELKQSMVPELTLRLRKLTSAASEAERINLTSEQSLLAFDTAAALLNLHIPISSSRRKDLPSSKQITEIPPDVSVVPSHLEINPNPTTIPVVEVFSSNNYFYSTYIAPNTRNSSFKDNLHHPSGVDSDRRKIYTSPLNNDRSVTSSPFISPLGTLISPLGRVIDPLSAVYPSSTH